jgi:hypothetical protein
MQYELEASRCSTSLRHTHTCEGREHKLSIQRPLHGAQLLHKERAARGEVLCNGTPRQILLKHHQMPRKPSVLRREHDERQYLTFVPATQVN